MPDAHVHVAGRIDLEPVDGVLTLGAGHVEEHLATGHRAAIVERVPHDDLFGGVPVADVEVALIGRQRDAIRPRQLRGNQRHLAVAHGEDAAERQLLLRVCECRGQAERRVGEVQGPVGGVHEVVGAVQPLAVILVGEDGDVAVRLNADHAPVPVLADGQPAFGVEGEPVRAGLGVAADVGAGVSALGAEDRNRVIGCAPLTQISA